MAESPEKLKKAIDLKRSIKEIGKVVAIFGMYFFNHHIPIGVDGGNLKTASITDPILTSKPFKYMAGGAYRKESLDGFTNGILSKSPLAQEMKRNENKKETVNQIYYKLLEYINDSGRGVFQVVDNSYKSREKIGILATDSKNAQLVFELLSNDTAPLVGTYLSGGVAIAAELPLLHKLTPYKGPDNWNEIDWGDIISDLIGILASGKLSLLVAKLSTWEIEKLEALIKFLNQKLKLKKITSSN